MEIKTPDLGVESAEVSEIMVSVGDKITEDDNIVLLESDKASVEVPSSASGTVTKISVSVGDTVSEGSVLIELDADEEGGDSSNTDANSANPESSQFQESDIQKSDNQKSDNQQSNADAAQRQAAEQQHDDSDQTSNEASNDRSKSTRSEATSTTYPLPDLGVEEAEVAEVMVEVGDEIDAEQSLLLIESDKASVEVPSPVSGIVEKLLVKAGDTVANGQDFIVIKGSEGSENSHSENQSQGNDGAASNNDENKNTSVNSSSDQQSASQAKASQDDSNKVNAKSPDKHGSNNQGSSKLSESEVNSKLADVYAGPAVRKMARQLGVDISQVEGSAINKRIVKEDIFDFVKSRLNAASSASTNPAKSVASGLPNLPDMSNSEIWGNIETQDLSRLQKVSIPQLNYNTYLPQVTQFDLSDITETETLRKALKAEFKAEGIGLTILAFIVKATAYALMQYPRFNSHLSDDNTQIHIRQTVNMGIAVATDDGLIVPVIKNAQDKGIKQIAVEIGELAAKARDKKLGTKDLQGASFTISSQGNLGGTYFTPLVNWPQVGILGISEASMQPRWNEESQNFEPRLMLPLSLSYDHRVINGADAAVFTRYIAKLLADPRRILI